MFYPSFSRRSDPFDLMQSMLRDIDDLFGLRAGTATFPAVNVWQGDEAIAITAEIPGVDIADLDISVKDNVLTISGERKLPELHDGARWHRSERSYGRFARSIRLPFAASDDRVEARLTNGVLRIVVARPEEDKPRRIAIKAA